MHVLLGSSIQISNLILAGWNSWQVISPVEVSGYVTVVDELLSVQNKSYGRPTILVARSVKGEEEIPDGTVAVLTPDMPDVLSHVSVRARNSKVIVLMPIYELKFWIYMQSLWNITAACGVMQVCFATCFDSNILTELQANEGKLFCLKPTSSDILYR